MRKLLAILILVLGVLVGISCSAPQPVSQKEKQRIEKNKAALLATTPGDLVEFDNGQIARVDCCPTARESGLDWVEMRLDFIGENSWVKNVNPAGVKLVYFHNTKVTYTGTDFIPANPEKDAWKDATERYVLGNTSTPVAGKRQRDREPTVIKKPRLTMRFFASAVSHRAVYSARSHEIPRCIPRDDKNLEIRF